MLIFETSLLLAVHCMKQVSLKSTESKFASNHSSICSETMLLSFQKSVVFGLETNMLVSPANKMVKDLLVII